MNLSESDICANVNSYLQQHNLPTNPTSSDKLPYLYWTSKFHKNPSGFRFITSGRDTSLSYLSKTVGQCLLGLLKIDKSTSKFVHKYKNYHNHFIVDNRDPVIDFIKWANGNSNNRKSIRTFDFTSLYTMIPHSELKDHLFKFVNKIFTIKDKKFLTISSQGNAYFSKYRSKKLVSFSCSELISHINFIIDNSYIIFNGQVYRQIIGIPMGVSCAPHMANIFLHVSEYEFVDDLVTVNRVDDAALLTNLFRYQDDCIVFEDLDSDGENFFENNFSSIYPSSMELKNTNVGPRSCTYLDLYISIYRGKYNFRSYDKRRDFNFEVINYPYLNSNIPKNPSYGVFISQLVRLVKINCNIRYFKNDVTALVNKFIDQGFNKQLLVSKFKQFSKKYLGEWTKLGEDITSTNFLRPVFQI